MPDRSEVVLTSLIGSILHAIGEFALDTIDALGYAGVFVLMVLESMVAPVPSEAVLPFAGFLAADGRMNLWLAWAVATAGTLVGSLLSYAMGWYGLRPALERWGRFVLVTPHHLDRAHRFFETRRAAAGVFVARFVPVVRHLISIPAGSARMPLGPFVLATVAGGGAWNMILLYAGYALGGRWARVREWARNYDLVLLAALGLACVVALVAWWLRRSRRAEPDAREGHP